MWVTGTTRDWGGTSRSSRLRTRRACSALRRGIGITVFRSMLRYIREEGLSYRVALVFSSRDRESTAFLDELQGLEQEISNFRLILTMTQDPGWAGETRKIDSRFFRDYLGEDVNENTFLVAGPPAMVEGVQEALEEAGVEAENVIAERYSGY
ncbi:MAG: ferredoxin--NADP reductase [Gaiellaceae bacterium]